MHLFEVSIEAEGERPLGGQVPGDKVSAIIVNVRLKHVPPSRLVPERANL